TRGMQDFTAELARRSGWDGIAIDGPPLRIPADLVSDPVPDWLGAHPITPIEAGIRRTLAELRDCINAPAPAPAHPGRQTS
ncbi:hypothetical protein O4J55_07535, partial [Paracoccus sp. PXZ]